jgi:Winged helix DNA-binding domain
LLRHGLAGQFADGGPAAVAAALAGVHAQVMTSAELAIGLRLDGVTRADVRAAVWPAVLAERTLVRTFGPRGTVHLLPACDLGLWTALLSPVASALPGFAPGVRLTPTQAQEVLAAIPDALAAADDGLTIDELDAAVVQRTGSWAGDLVMPAFQGWWPRWRQVLHQAGMRGTLCFGPNRGRKVTYVRPPGFGVQDPRTAMAWAVRSYLHAYGPATPDRFANWLSIPVPRAAEIFGSCDLEQVDVEGTPAWVAAGDTEVPPELPPHVLLLPYFDGYSYRVGVQSPELLYPGPAAARAYPWAFQNLVVDGVVAGVWQQRRSGRRIDITVEPVVRLTAAQRADVGEQAERVAAISEGRARLEFGTVTSGPHA